jgi:hypothetical protein
MTSERNPFLSHPTPSPAVFSPSQGERIQLKVTMEAGMSEYNLFQGKRTNKKGYRNGHSLLQTTI